MSTPLVRRLTVGSDTLTGRLEDAYLQVTITEQNSGVSKIDVTVVDEELKLLGSNLVRKGNPLRLLTTDGTLHRFTTIGYTVKQAAVPETTIVGVDAGAHPLMHQDGQRIWRRVSPTAWLRARARAAGMGFTGQPSAVQKQITRDKDESTWDVAQRLADDLGFWVWVSRRHCYFGKPSWFATGNADVVYRWPTARRGELSSWSGIPTLSSRDNRDDPITAQLEVHPGEFDNLYVGTRIAMRGIPRFSTKYLITSLKTTFTNTEPCTVTMSTPHDPEPMAE